MSVSAAGPNLPIGPATSSTTATASASGFDYNTFMQLLVAQLKNQDPTNPMDASQYVQQFSTLAQVEQSVNSNAKLDEILGALYGIGAIINDKLPSEPTETA